MRRIKILMVFLIAPAVNLGAEGQTVLTSVSQFSQLEWSEGDEFCFEGKAWIVYDGGSGLFIQDESGTMTVNIDTYGASIESGSILSRFKGIIQLCGGGYSALYNIKRSSLELTGEIETLTPIEADSTKGFQDYWNCLAKYHNVSVTKDDWLTVELENGDQGCLGGLLDEGKYEYIVAIVGGASTTGLPLVNLVEAGPAAGIGCVIENSQAQVKATYTLQGVKVDSQASGLVIEQLSDGSTRKVLR